MSQDKEKIVELTERMLETQKTIITLLEVMTADINKIKGWIVFWGIMGVISAIIWGIIWFVNLVQYMGF